MTEEQALQRIKQVRREDYIELNGTENGFESEWRMVLPAMQLHAKDIAAAQNKLESVNAKISELEAEKRKVAEAKDELDHVRSLRRGSMTREQKVKFVDQYGLDEFKKIPKD